MLATAGLGFLSLQGGLGMSKGDLLTLVGALAFAAQIAATGFFAPRTKPAVLALTQIVAAAALFVVVTPFTEHVAWDFGWQAWAAIVWTALSGTVFGFLIQAWAQKSTTSTRAAVILGLEGLFAAAFGLLFGMDVLSPAVRRRGGTDPRRCDRHRDAAGQARCAQPGGRAPARGLTRSGSWGARPPRAGRPGLPLVRRFPSGTLDGYGRATARSETRWIGTGKTGRRATPHRLGVPPTSPPPRTIPAAEPQPERPEPPDESVTQVFSAEAAWEQGRGQTPDEALPHPASPEYVLPDRTETQGAPRRAPSSSARRAERRVGAARGRGERAAVAGARDLTTTTSGGRAPRQDRAARREQRRRQLRRRRLVALAILIAVVVLIVVLVVRGCGGSDAAATTAALGMVFVDGRLPGGPGATVRPKQACGGAGARGRARRARAPRRLRRRRRDGGAGAPLRESAGARRRYPRLGGGRERRPPRHLTMAAPAGSVRGSTFRSARST